MRFDSITDIEDYVRDIIGIPYVNFDGMDIKVCSELVNTLEEAFFLYPLLGKAICAIGHSQYIEEQINLIDNMDTFIGYCEDYSKDFDANNTWMTTVLIDEDSKDNIYIGINISKLISHHNLDELNLIAKENAIFAYHPTHCVSFKSIIYHEIGHIFDFLLKITENHEFLKLLETINLELEVSRYAMLNQREAFAEAFAEYHMADQPNEAVRKIVEIGLEEYRKRAEKKSEIFDVSRRFR